MSKESLKAVKEGEIVAVKELLDNGIDVNLRDENGMTALIQASSQGHTDIVRLLLERGAAVNARTKDGWSALMEAALYDFTDIFKLLVEHGADIHAITPTGWTVTEFAAWKILETPVMERPSPEIIRYLIDNGGKLRMNTLMRLRIQRII